MVPASSISRSLEILRPPTRSSCNAEQARHARPSKTGLSPVSAYQTECTYRLEVSWAPPGAHNLIGGPHGFGLKARDVVMRRGCYLLKDPEVRPQSPGTGVGQEDGSARKGETAIHLMVTIVLITSSEGSLGLDTE